jgi:CDP-diacylglycerol--glycerol-3-phosphate 3-phosphatidyltransferase
MTVADKVTSFRLVVGPVFYIVYFFHSWLGIAAPAWTVPVLWILFITGEASDAVDGFVARARGEVGDFGKLYDPFADVLFRLTYFFCFTLDGILPALLLGIIVYREFAILFLRTLFMQKGISQGARKGGKIKALTYMVTGALALLVVSLERFSVDGPFVTLIKNGALFFFVGAVFLSLWSFADYVKVYVTVSNEKA